MSKKRYIRVLLTAAACMVMLLLSTVPASAQTIWEKRGYAQITTPTALRSKFNNKNASTIIRIVPAGAVVQISKYIDKGWYEVVFGSKKGYLMDDYFTTEDDLDPDSSAVYRTLSVNMGLRTSPKVLSNNVSCVIAARKQVEILGERSDNWVHVAYEDFSGYIPNGFFTTDKGNGKGYSYKITSQPLYVRSSPTSSPSNTVALLKKGRKVKVTGVSGSWYRILYKGSTRYVKAGYFKTDTKEDYVEETVASVVNFRQSPSEQGAKILANGLPHGAVVKVLGETAKVWYKVQYGSHTGYVHEGYFASDRTMTPDDDEDSVRRITTAALRMRTERGTDDDSTIITVIPNGSIVTLSIKYGSWYKVYYATPQKTYYGWVSGAYLATID